MRASRICSRPGCTRPAAETLTYDYSGSTAVLGPLAIHAEPHSYDLCDEHGRRLTAPRGWDVIRLAAPATTPTGPSSDDIEALADAVREAARADPVADRQPDARPGIGRRGHLRVLSSDS